MCIIKTDKEMMATPQNLGEHKRSSLTYSGTPNKGLDDGDGQQGDTVCTYK